MSDDEGCGRPPYHAPAGAEAEPICLMHSRDPNKDVAEFHKEVVAILRGKSKYHRRQDRYDFQRFVFPQEDRFSKATFDLTANFSRATFLRNADFSGATFTQDADFSEAQFTQDADFSGGTFNHYIDFSLATFLRNANFSGATFTREANFSGAAFTQTSNFLTATFSLDANFSDATFTQTVDFLAATFNQSANFFDTTFIQAVSFYAAKFNRHAYFSMATFLDLADFSYARFKEPAQVLFHRVNEGQEKGMRARFRNCLLDGLRFEDVNWDRLRGRLILQDERDLGTRVGRTHEVVADVYRRMVKNFERNRQYTLAEDCFVGEMEMRRLNPRNFLFARFTGSFYDKHRWARWLGEQCSFTNLYRALSDYGSSYRRALVALLGLLFLFALLLPTCGLRLPPGSPAQTAPGTPEAAEISWGSALAHPPRMRQCLGTLGAGLLASIEIATFQKSPARGPANGWTRLVAAFETVVIPGQLAIFLLALRRRFRR
jgi:uncharacterized protein YjbI with pentapeptide repeats